MNEKLSNFINECWNNHASDSETVAKNLKSNLNLITEKNEIPSYVAITNHTFGGHLGDFKGAIELLNQIKELDFFEEEQSVYRGLASMNYCDGNKDEFTKYLNLANEAGSKVKIYASAASELVAQKRIKDSTKAFFLAKENVPNELSAQDPIAKSIAIAGNNLACELEELKSRTEEENELMLDAALTARKYWEIAGNWVNVERAEYRLAMSYLKASRFEEALRHGNQCLNICVENKADETEMFFAHEVLTKINRTICEDLFEKLPEGMKPYCKIP